MVHVYCFDFKPILLDKFHFKADIIW